MKKLILLTFLLAACSSVSLKPEGETTPELQIAQSSCETPDGTYAESVYEEWRGVGFNLPYCWGVETGADENGVPWVYLSKNDEGQETSFVFHNVNPLTDDFVEVDTRKIGIYESTHYRSGDSHIYAVEPKGIWFETNDPSDRGVEILLDSITFLDP